MHHVEFTTTGASQSLIVLISHILWGAAWRSHRLIGEAHLQGMIPR